MDVDVLPHLKIALTSPFIDRNKKAPGRSGLWAQFDITISPIADPQSKVKQNMNRLRLFPAMTTEGLKMPHIAQ